jgi:hypothetical protein
MKNIKKVLLFTCLLFTSFTCLIAQEIKLKPRALRFLIMSGLELGGDEIAEVYFTNGNSQGVKAGQGISLGIGGQYQIPGAEKLLLRGTVGIKYVTTAADNAHIRLTRFPIHLNANWMITNKLLIGAGLASHRAIRFKADGVGDDVKFFPANGPRFEVSYAGIGLTYTAMKYKEQGNASFSANSIGLSLTGVLPKM